MSIGILLPHSLQAPSSMNAAVYNKWRRLQSCTYWAQHNKVHIFSQVNLVSIEQLFCVL